MIASLNGEVIDIGDNSLVVRVGGVGLTVFVPVLLTKQAQVGSYISLHTHLVVREDSLTLYGFQTIEEVRFFNLLLGVNGVGPRHALAALSTLTVDAIRRAVLSEQPGIFSRVPGIGKKGAQKIILHLQGRVGEPSPLATSPSIDVDTEVLEALTGLGYSVVEAQAALQAIPRDAPLEVEERLRIALRYFAT
jgi:Holliday junction DNA helicase RuvA